MKKEKFSLALSTKIFSVGVPRQLSLSRFECISHISKVKLADSLPLHWSIIGLVECTRGMHLKSAK